MMITASPLCYQEQYVFLYEAVADSVLFGTHCIKKCELARVYEFLDQKDDLTGRTRLELQYEVRAREPSGLSSVLTGLNPRGRHLRWSVCHQVGQFFSRILRVFPTVKEQNSTSVNQRDLFDRLLQPGFHYL